MSDLLVKLTDLAIKEASAVDDPAHQIPGWLVMKSRGDSLSEDFCRVMKAALDAKRPDLADHAVALVLQSVCSVEELQGIAKLIDPDVKIENARPPSDFVEAAFGIPPRRF